jgi:LPXTG-motif cell wall-anchored protein
MRFWVASAVLSTALLSASAASACLNDEDSPKYERQQQQQYALPEPLRLAFLGPMTGAASWAMTGFGATSLVVAGTAAALFARRRRRP